MENIFSKELKRYYVRKGNRIIFRNGSSLNRLAIDMSERLGFSQIDASVISKVLQGKRFFSQNQLEIFCRILRLSAKDRDSLKLSLHSEIFKRFEGRYFLNLEGPRLIDSAEENLSIIKETNYRGLPLLAFELATMLEEKIEQAIKKEKSLVNAGRLKNIAFDVLDQQAVSILRTENAKNVYGKVGPILKKMENIANDLENPKMVGLSFAKTGDLLSLTGDYHHSKKELESSLKYLDKSLKTIDRKIEIYPASYAMLSASYLRKNNLFSELKSKVKIQIKEADYSNKTEAYNLIARGKVALGDYHGLEKDFIAGWNAYHLIPETGKGSKAYRRVQLLRTEIHAAIAGYRFRDRLALQKIILDCLYTSKQLGYKRYFETTKDLIRKHHLRLKINPELIPGN